jgi:2-hydroxy-3-keto-5-methylthiopentenyl-1-phosphate phosphatase
MMPFRSTDQAVKKVVAADFDGTLLKNDLAELVLARFAGEGWRCYDDLLENEKITLEECMRRQYAMVEVSSRREVIEYVDRYCIFRPGVKKLVSECEARGIDLTIVSAGLDFCIRHAFQKNGIELPRLVCPRSSFKKGKGFGVTFPASRSRGSANFKESFVSSCQRRGMSVTFVGNGMGDLHAAIRADAVFAIKDSRLDVLCNERGIAHESVKDLVPVWKSLHA